MAIELEPGARVVPHSPAPNWDSILEYGAQAPTILIIDEIDLNRRLLKAMLKTSSYRILEATRPSEGLAILGREKVDLLVVDQMMPEMSGTEFCQLVKNDRRTQLVPVLVTTSIQGVENEVAGFESGADEFLIKPLRPALVRTHIRSMLRKKALIDSLEEAETILFALAPDETQFTQMNLMLAPPPGADLDPLPDLVTAFQEQLGMKLESTKAPVDVIVIDKISRPSEN